MPLAEREREVLTTIIEAYITSAAPVGSRVVSKLSSLGLSAASIRNIMADLTETGYLEQPHTSAGRIPTAKAFRLYLDQVMRLSPLGDDQKRRIIDNLTLAGLELDDVLRQASRLLSGLSLQVSMVIAPNPAGARFKRIDFSLLNPGLVMVLLVLQGGLVRKRVIETAPDVTPDDLVACSNYLNHLFTDRTLDEVRTRIVREMDEARRSLNALCLRALTMARSTFEQERAPASEVIVDGTPNILSQPEFTDAEHMRELMRVLEERTILLDLLDKTVNGLKTVIIIGDESDQAALSELGVITAPYGTGRRTLGAIGLIGPLRMDYAKLVPVVNYTASTLTRLLDRHF
ncbi:Heat-inducible transcription repressor HrcA [Desulfovibrio sp. DV]|uniref:heat-inducible transcriptional repressor HrcA n=1 Tax=Desulfovibrio sp. DV TaxID=1844708 RepID=UPI00094B7BF7|nr:heat-inducible transcriptional repressor HrcA [Desulfovibrio sp. DV]OLN29140.1 Heat-inducible transcription repressor HrcA [Desulfovibrio sp. DV]